MAKKIDLKDKNAAELTELLRGKREEVRTVRFGMAARSANGNGARTARRDVARLLTELTKRSKEQA